MIKSIELQNFRIFKKQKFDFSKPVVIINGQNAKGKTTVLEAIHLVLNGTSPWSNEQATLLNTEQKDTYFTITIELVDEEGNENILTLFQDPHKKSYLINKKRVQKKTFFSNRKANLFNPEQIELLMYLSQERRDFLDKLISIIDPEYEESLGKYKKVLKQRNAYLKKLAKRFYETGRMQTNDQQLRFWTKLIAEISTILMIKRAEIIKKLKSDFFSIEYKPSLVLNLFEDMLNESSLRDIYIKTLDENIRRDIATGVSNIGAHRDDWSIISAKKDLKKFGSRGEKRIAIGRLILQTQEILKEYIGQYPILLLDDISAELDDINTFAIFSDEIINHQQTFITTIDTKNT
jgi:DNA replication and repair protein RecF